MSIAIERNTCRAPDGLPLVYSAAGAGEPALVFIHGGLADRSFYDGQLATFAPLYRVLAPDLAGHGESGTERTRWGIPELGADVRAVLDAEGVGRAILLGNSLGGPVAVETALLLGDRAVGVVGIDTFHSLDYRMTTEQAVARAEAFRADLAGSARAMTRALFHADAAPAVMARAERPMLRMSPAVVYALFVSMGGYDTAAAVRRLAAPLRTINGDLYPTDVAAVQRIQPGFRAIVMRHTGHYPMLERPDEFDEHVATVVGELSPTL